jgi:hypothetical protein
MSLELISYFEEYLANVRELISARVGRDEWAEDRFFDELNYA